MYELQKVRRLRTISLALLLQSLGGNFHIITKEKHLQFILQVFIRFVSNQ